MRPSRSSLLAPARVAAGCLLLAANSRLRQGDELEAGAVLLELSLAGGVSTPDELRVSVYDDGGTLWKDARVPGTGALVPESATRLGTRADPARHDAGRAAHSCSWLRGLHARRRRDAGDSGCDARPVRAAARRRRSRRRGRRRRPGRDRRLPGRRQPRPGRLPGQDDDGAAAPAAAAAAAAAAVAVATGGSGGAPTTAAARTRSSCDASGGCNRAIGAACTDGMQCTSSFCVDGVCCMNACIGPCRSCNQPNNDGLCQPYAQGSNPAVECTAGATCNGAGACGPPTGGPKPNGQLCGAGTECTSGFCKDGVCCNNACDTPCRTCETGTCVDVRRKPDPPECYGTMTLQPDRQVRATDSDASRAAARGPAPPSRGARRRRTAARRE